MAVKFVLNCKGTSLNHSKIPFKGRLIPSPEFKKNKKIYENELIPHRRLIQEILCKPFVQTSGVNLKIHFYFDNLFAKSHGKISKAVPDLDNMLKGLIDCIFEVAGVDDNIVMEIVARKERTNSESYISVEIEENLQN